MSAGIDGVDRVNVPQKKVSKRKVLNLARRHIELLDQAKRDLEAEKQQLLRYVERSKGL